MAEIILKIFYLLEDFVPIREELYAHSIQTPNVVVVFSGKLPEEILSLDALSSNKKKYIKIGCVTLAAFSSNDSYSKWLYFFCEKYCFVFIITTCCI